ncbi:Aste57867_23636 [Aphanomyces stellatus]|uniref:Aste57867_23636 protein n=1 Tax=Aphanomyces stellatus TaxID=120398 RepID=A0A485LNK9_9STRA|nr:hypothetical protein As57867_023564 [Aphanomyces stellatus]VFU00281.1 Aste57867_23636 [Aphanomyces stellatus]
MGPTKRRLVDAVEGHPSPHRHVHAITAAMETRDVLLCIFSFQGGVHIDMRPLAGLQLPLHVQVDLVLGLYDGLTSSLARVHASLSTWTDVHGTSRLSPLLRCLPRLWDVLVLDAIVHGNERTVAWLVAHQLDKLTSFWVPLLDIAAHCGHLSLLRLLHGTPAGHCTSAAMHAAAVHGDLPIVQFLHAHRREGCKAHTLLFAARKGRADVVRFLCSHRLGGSVVDASVAAARAGHIPVVAALLPELQRQPVVDLMEEAADAGQLRMVEWLCRQGFPTDGARVAAVASGHIAIVEALWEPAVHDHMIAMATRHVQKHVMRWLQRKARETASDEINVTRNNNIQLLSLV